MTRFIMSLEEAVCELFGGLNYDKFFKEGDTKRATIDEFNSDKVYLIYAEPTNERAQCQVHLNNAEREGGRQSQCSRGSSKAQRVEGSWEFGELRRKVGRWFGDGRVYPELVEGEMKGRTPHAPNRWRDRVLLGGSRETATAPAGRRGYRIEILKEIQAIMKGDFLQHPRYILMDTCCFVDYLNDCNRDFNYKKITQFVNENGYNIIISVYTLLEIVQSLNNEDEVEDTLQKFMRKDDFWVLNVNRVLGDDILFEYGLDFWIKLKMGKQFPFEEFKKERQDFYTKCYKSLYPKMYLFTELMTQMYILFKECRAKSILGDTMWAINNVHLAMESRKSVLDGLFEMYFIHSGCARFNLLHGVLDENTNPRDVLHDRLFDLMLELLSVVYSKKSLIQDKIDGDDGEFNRRITIEYNKLLNNLRIADLARQATKCKNKTQGVVTIDCAFDFCTNGMAPSILKESYRKMLKRVFTNGNFGKSFNNSFIDFTNLGVMELFEDKLRNYDAIYLTRDKEWRDFMFKHNNKIFVQNTRRFYDEFMTIG